MNHYPHSHQHLSELFGHHTACTAPSLYWWGQETDSSLDNEHHGDADIEETYDFPLDNEHLGGVDIGESRPELLKGSFPGEISLIRRSDVRTSPYLNWWDQEQDPSLDNEHHGDADTEES